MSAEKTKMLNVITTFVEQDGSALSELMTFNNNSNKNNNNNSI